MALACASDAPGAGPGGGGGAGPGSGGAGLGASVAQSIAVTGSSSSLGGATASSDDGRWLALACSSDADCGPFGRCAAADDDDPHFHGGPAGGYCTKACQSDADCGPGNTCMDTEDGGVCLLGCTPAEPHLTHINDDLDPDKCHGREDLGCLPSSSGSTRGACIPVCGSDARCPGRKCDPRYGVCVDTPRAGLPTGAACPGTGEECAGICLKDTEGNSQCTSRCVFGGELFSTSDCGGLDQGICIIRFASNGVGDIGACASACRQHSDCQNPFLWCTSTPVTDHGFCVPTKPCPGGEAECPEGSECTETAYGPYCIDGTIPLGDALPGAGGAGGADGAGGAAGAP